MLWRIVRKKWMSVKMALLLRYILYATFSQILVVLWDYHRFSRNSPTTGILKWFVTFTGACGPPEKLSLVLVPRPHVLRTIVQLPYWMITWSNLGTQARTIGHSECESAVVSWEKNAVYYAKMIFNSDLRAVLMLQLKAKEWIKRLRFTFVVFEWYSLRPRAQMHVKRQG